MAGKELQEALERVVYTTVSLDMGQVPENYSLGALQKDFDTLQELINKYNSMRGDYMSYQDLKAEYEQEITKLKKVVDKAIDILNFQEICPNVLFGYGTWDCPNEKEHKYDCDECWKKYLFKESEK